MSILIFFYYDVQITFLIFRSDDKELIDQWLSDITSLYLNIEEVVQNKQDTVDDLLLKVGFSFFSMILFPFNVLSCEHFI